VRLPLEGERRTRREWLSAVAAALSAFSVAVSVWFATACDGSAPCPLRCPVGAADPGSVVVDSIVSCGDSIRDDIGLVLALCTLDGQRQGDCYLDLGAVTYHCTPECPQ